MRVAIFTDNDFDKTKGVTTTLRAVLRHLPDDVHARIYTASELCSDGPDYLALAEAACRAVALAEAGACRSSLLKTSLVTPSLHRRSSPR